jgi:hypothetical protein
MAVSVSEAQAMLGRVERERQILHFVGTGADDAASFWGGMPLALALSTALWAIVVIAALALLA